MSVLGGPFIGDVGDDLICAFHPEIPISFGDGESLGQQVVDTQSFNKTNVSKYITSTIENNDGYWGNPVRVVGDISITNKGLTNQQSGVYTSFSNGKIHNTETLKYTYQLPSPITNYFLNNSLTICGWFKVDKFPNINNKTKQRLGVVGVNYPGYNPQTQSQSYHSSGIGVHRVGVRKADDSNKFCIGVQTNIFGSMSFSIFSDYLYDVGKWYFFSYRLGFTDDENYTLSAFNPSLWVNGEPVMTYYASGVNFFYKKDKDKGYPDRPNVENSLLSNFFPARVGFKNIYNSDVSLNGGPLNSGWSQNASAISYTHSITPYGYIWTNWRNFLEPGSPISDKTDTDITLSFLHLPKYKGSGGYHDNISIGSHFVLKSAIESTNLFNSYKSLYL